MSRILLRQGLSYGVIGGTILVVDWLLFVALSASGMPIIPANLFGRTSGAALGFWCNGTFTFSDVEGRRLGWRRLLRFLASWLVMTGLSTFAMYAINQHMALGWAWFAKPFVDGFLAVLGFLTSRYWIYK